MMGRIYKKGASELEQCAHRLYDYAQKNDEAWKKTRVMCWSCGSRLETSYCEDRLYIVRCPKCVIETAADDNKPLIYEKIQRDIFEEAEEENVNFGEYVLTLYFDKYEVRDIIEGITGRYERYAHPYRKPWQKLKEAFAEWWKDFTYRRFKRYFRRRRK